MSPLNPQLYAALQSRFGRVDVANAGQQTVVRRVRSWGAGADWKDEVTAWGECYRVDCPECGDQRGRLYICNAWNTVREGRPFGRYLLKCHNEDCKNMHLDSELRMYMLTSGLVTATVRAATPEESDGVLRPVSLPGRCLPLLDLPSDHPAKIYLRSRGFEPDELARQWSLYFCVDTPADNNGHVPGTLIFARMVTNRIIIPIFWNGQLVGWQARSLNNYTDVKYYTSPGLKKRFMLFNGDRAAHDPVLIITEGVMKCARVGHGVALLGKSMSQHQAYLIATTWKEKPVCILFDPDAQADADAVRAELAGRGVKAFVAAPPADPDTMTTDAIWLLIYQAAAGAGISLL